jgi:hypothetical protein
MASKLRDFLAPSSQCRPGQFISLHFIRTPGTCPTSCHFRAMQRTSWGPGWRLVRVSMVAPWPARRRDDSRTARPCQDSFAASSGEGPISPARASPFPVRSGVLPVPVPASCPWSRARSDPARSGVLPVPAHSLPAVLPVVVLDELNCWSNPGQVN